MRFAVVNIGKLRLLLGQMQVNQKSSICRYVDKLVVFHLLVGVISCHYDLLCFHNILLNFVRKGVTTFMLVPSAWKTKFHSSKKERAKLRPINIGIAFLYPHIIAILKVCGSNILFKLSFYGRFASSDTETYKWLIIINTTTNFIITLPHDACCWYNFLHHIIL
jgi:hypothetical protein